MKKLIIIGILGILLISLAYAFEGTDVGNNYNVIGSISQGQDKDTDAGNTYEVDVSASAVTWGVFTDAGNTYEVCLGPYCLQLDAPTIPSTCGDGIITPGSAEVCDGNDPTWTTLCDDYTVDGCDWGTTITDCDTFTSDFVAGQQNLKCSRYCKFDIAGCENASDIIDAVGTCGNSALEWNETCEWVGDPSDDGNAVFRDVDRCSMIDAYTGGVLKCVPPGYLNECHLDASGCNEGIDNNTMFCGDAYDPAGAFLTISCDDNFAAPPPVPGVINYNDPPNTLTQVCAATDMCVYGYEAFEPDAYELGYMVAANCYPNGTTIENAGPPPFNEPFEITCNAYEAVGMGIPDIPLAQPVWCPEGYKYVPATMRCELAEAVCDWGFPENPGGTLYDCYDIENVLINDLRCLNNFDGNIDPYPTDGPTWKGACCEFVRIGSFRLYRDTEIVVY